MKRTILLTLAALLITGALFSQPWQLHGPIIQVPGNPHYLQHQDGTPFFWLGDTGWEMLHRLSREEIPFYLSDRKKKGFNVIQTVIISEFIHSNKSVNFYGDPVLTGDNPDKPAVTPGNNPMNPEEYDYWDHVDFAVKTAEEFGLYLALVATWGEWVVPREGKPLFNTTEQAYHYGHFLGNRYNRAPNIIWILGGDRHPNERKEGVELWRAMAEGIADGVNGQNSFDGKADYSTTLMSHHAYNSSSNWFHDDPWIDFHQWGSYHAEIDNKRSYEVALADWKLDHPKPTLNAEPCYEGHGINYAIDDNGYFTATDVRLAAYWSVFSGAMGFTYGAQTIWQFTDYGRKKLSPKTLLTWQESLDLPGAMQVIYLKKLMTSRPMNDLEPDLSMIISGQGSCGSYVPVIRGKSHAFVYIPTGNQITLTLGKISGQKIKGWWFNPRTGIAKPIGEFENTGEKSFDVPGMSEELSWLRTGRGCDWVLVLDDASKNFPAP
jgi:hypothetical protein